MLENSEIEERDPTAIQRELLRLAEESVDIAKQQEAVELAYHNALRDKKMLECKQKWIKQRVSALQSVLKSISRFDI